ncbi:MAG: glutamate 5-kinase [Balneolaceae bacterium]
MDEKQTKRTGLPENIRRIVVKVGSRVLVDDQGKPDLERIEELTSEIVSLKEQNYEIILVSSGAIAAGVQTLELKERPSNLPDLQMAAAVGQSVLMQHYTVSFLRHKCRVGQVLLTHTDLENRERHLNARYTMMAMLRSGVIPIVNENDVVAVDEIRFGDNDVLASLVSTLIDGDILILLTTSDGFYRTENGKLKERIPYLDSITSSTLSMAQGKGSKWSSGGMASKLKAADHAARAGTPVVIANGAEKNIIRRILNGEDTGTLIMADQKKQPLNARKKWIAFFNRPEGSIVVDDGAVEAIRRGGNSLLPAGVQEANGQFHMGALVNICDANEKIVARGITSYSQNDIEKIKGRHSTEIESLLGNCHYEEVVHRDNLVVMEEKFEWKT